MTVLGSATVDNLIYGGGQKVETKSATLLAGNVFKRGCLLKLSGDKVTPVTNSSDTPYAIFAGGSLQNGALEDGTTFTDWSVDATTEDKVGTIYIGGVFNTNAIILGGGTIGDFWDELRTKNIILKDASKQV
jgi:hypothetical protein